LATYADTTATIRRLTCTENPPSDTKHRGGDIQKDTTAMTDTTKRLLKYWFKPPKGYSRGFKAKVFKIPKERRGIGIYSFNPGFVVDSMTVGFSFKLFSFGGWAGISVTNIEKRKWYRTSKPVDLQDI
jgi:hypothetical protein